MTSYEGWANGREVCAFTRERLRERKVGARTRAAFSVLPLGRRPMLAGVIKARACGTMQQATRPKIIICMRLDSVTILWNAKTSAVLEGSDKNWLQIFHFLGPLRSDFIFLGPDQLRSSSKVKSSTSGSFRAGREDGAERQRQRQGGAGGAAQ